VRGRRRHQRQAPFLGQQGQRVVDLVQDGVECVGDLDGDVGCAEQCGQLVEGAAAGNLSGRVDDLTIDIQGAGILSAGDLRAKRAKVSVEGAGQVTVNASDELDADVSGAGIIWYVGAPKLKSNVDGLGWIKRKPFPP